MQKIISLFQRNYDTDRLVRNEVVPGAEWVLKGEGIPTRKWDGACCMIRNGEFLKRYELKPGKTPPPNFESTNEVDEITGKQAGWVPVGKGPEDKWFREAWNSWFSKLLSSDDIKNGTYEAVGPHFGGGSHEKNPEGLDVDTLKKHGDFVFETYVPRDFNGLREYFETMGKPGIEGIVWHHPDGRMVKIKARDFGVKR